MALRCVQQVDQAAPQPSRPRKCLAVRRRIGFESRLSARISFSYFSLSWIRVCIVLPSPHRGLPEEPLFTRDSTVNDSTAGQKWGEVTKPAEVVGPFATFIMCELLDFEDHSMVAARYGARHVCLRTPPESSERTNGSGFYHLVEPSSHGVRTVAGRPA